MDLETLIAHWSGRVPPAILAEGTDRCAQPRCRGKVTIKRDVERAQKRQDSLDAAPSTCSPPQPERVHKASELDIGVCPWSARPKPEGSPLPAPRAEDGKKSRPGIKMACPRRRW